MTIVKDEQGKEFQANWGDTNYERIDLDLYPEVNLNDTVVVSGGIEGPRYIITSDGRLFDLARRVPVSTIENKERELEFPVDVSFGIGGWGEGDFRKFADADGF